MMLLEAWSRIDALWVEIEDTVLMRLFHKQVFIHICGLTNDVGGER